MNRIEVLRHYIEHVLLGIEDNEVRRCAYSHLYGVALTSAILARKRGLNSELATMAGMLHDIYTYKTMITEEHAQKGAYLAKEILNELNITTDEETQIIYSAIYNHSNKGTIDSDFDEMLKDADVLQHCMYNPAIDILQHEKSRYENIMSELGLNY